MIVQCLGGQHVERLRLSLDTYMGKEGHYRRLPLSKQEGLGGDLRIWGPELPERGLLHFRAEHLEVAIGQIACWQPRLGRGPYIYMVGERRSNLVMSTVNAVQKFPYSYRTTLSSQSLFRSGPHNTVIQRCTA